MDFETGNLVGIKTVCFNKLSQEEIDELTGLLTSLKQIRHN
jgi:hypothetical protein